jgi:hypothetical protein
MDNRRTFSDQLDLLDISYPKMEHARTRHAMRAAVRTVYQSLPLKHEWTHLRRCALIATHAPVDATADIESGVVTITSSTWPDWAALGTLIVGRDRFDIVERMSGTELRCDPLQVPDDATGQSVRLCQRRYDLPDDFGDMIDLTRMGGAVRLQGIDVEQWSDAEAWPITPGTPFRYTVAGPRGGKFQLNLYPAPVLAEQYRAFYRSQLRSLSGNGPFNAGKVTTTGTAATLSGTTQVWPQDAEGRVLRLGDATNEPTGQFNEHPYAAAYTVIRRASDTQLVLAESAVEATTVRYVLDDPIDIDPHAMGEYFDRACEAEFERLVRMPTRNEAQQNALTALKRAKELDYRQSKVNWGGQAMFWNDIWWRMVM